MSESNLHRPLVNAIAPALAEIFDEGAHADKVIERSLKTQRQWGSRDRRFFAEMVYDIVRWRRRLDWALTGRVNWEPKPQSAGEYGLMVAAYLIIRGHKELPSWIGPVGVSHEELAGRWEKCPSRAVRESIPDWLDDLGQKELGGAWDGALIALNKQAPVFLRANALLVSPQHLIRNLAAEGIEAEVVPELKEGVRLIKRANVFRTEAFSRGEFEMQDGGSQQVAPLLEAAAGERIIDACAGAGGKTLHLAAIMKNSGKIIALDVHERKLEELRKRARRARVDIIETRLIESTKVIKRLALSADRVLLDVPCSGLGVLRRNPDQKWKFTSHELSRLHDLQREIFAKYSEMVRVGGHLVYATCSILRSENEDQVRWFLESFESRWELETELAIAPERTSYDGFYAARLRRKA